MLILLPPSEGKAASAGGRPLDPDRLSLPALAPARERVLDALVALCAQPDDGPALAALGLGEGQRGEVARNARLRVAATLPGSRLYTGVLYAALDLPSVPAPARRSILIFSGLWGAVRPGDRIPPYRCPIGTSLPGVGTLSAYWKKALSGAVDEAAGGGPVLDLRSSAYAATWRPTGRLAQRSAAVRVLHEQVVDGQPRRSVVSHFNKATKGRLVRDLLTAGAAPRSRARLVEALRDLKYTVEEPAPGRLDVVVTQV